MKLHNRYEKVPAFGNDPKVDIELLKRMNQPREESRGWRVMGRVATATSLVSAAILIITIIIYITN